MQRLPLQLLKTKAQGTGAGVQSAKGNASAVAGDESAKSNGDFSALFAGLTGAEVKGEKGEALKNILGEKGSKDAKGESIDSLLKNGSGKTKTEKSEEGEEVEVFKTNITPEQAGAIVSALNAKQASQKGEVKATNAAHVKEGGGAGVEQKIAKTTNNLDQLLNSLKGTEENEAGEVEENSNPRFNNDQIPVKGDKKVKNESPLEFLVKGAKNKNVGENVSSPKTQDADGAPVPRKIMSAEDYLQNMHSAEKKTNAKLALVPEMEQGKMQQQQMANQKVKGYGQGLNLMSDPLIKNTKDLAFKDKSATKASADPLKAVDMKKGQELSQIKSDVLPVMNQREDRPAHLETQHAPKVLDLSKINTANTNEIIKKISDYVEQNQVANSSSLDLSVKHESLGEFKIQVSKMPNGFQGPNLVDMQITTSSKEGHDFFVKNEVSLMKNLNQAGINLSDLRIVSSMSESSAFGQTDSRQSSSFSQGQDGSRQYTSFESNSFSSEGGSQRRKELWEEYQQRYGA